MAEDIKVAIDHVVTIMTEALRQRKEEGIDLERHTRNFWNKIKKRLPEDAVKAMEENPTDAASQTAFVSGMDELMKAQNVKMSVVMFLYNKGVEL